MEIYTYIAFLLPDFDHLGLNITTYYHFSNDSGIDLDVDEIEIDDEQANKRIITPVQHSQFKQNTSHATPISDILTFGDFQRVPFSDISTVRGV